MAENIYTEAFISDDKIPDLWKKCNLSAQPKKPHLDCNFCHHN